MDVCPARGIAGHGRALNSSDANSASRLSDEPRKLLAGARRKRLSMDQVYEGLENQGVFALLSGTPHEAGDILPEYYVRQGIEQPDDVAKGHAKLLPTRCHTVETLAGHVLLSMIGSSVMRLAQIRLNDGEAYLASRMEALRSQGCILYKGRLVPDEPIQPANEVYQLFGVEVPTSVPIRGGSLAVDAAGELDRWLAWACRCRTPAFVELSRRAGRKREGIPGSTGLAVQTPAPGRRATRSRSRPGRATGPTTSTTS